MRSLWACLAMVAWAGAARAEVVVAQSGRSGPVACGGERAVLRGDGNRVTFLGGCAGLAVVGGGNVVGVELAPGARVRVDGDNNRIVYAAGGPAPEAVMRGAFNELVPGALPVAVPALVLDGRGVSRDLGCRGLDVVIRESAVRYLLHGGCRSLRIEGDRVTVAAELLPAALLTISGAGVVVNYSLVRDGPPPDVVVTSARNHATHLMRVGESALLLPTRTVLP